jgi:hypothetical protein
MLRRSVVLASSLDLPDVPEVTPVAVGPNRIGGRNQVGALIAKPEVEVYRPPNADCSGWQRCYVTAALSGEDIVSNFLMAFDHLLVALAATALCAAWIPARRAAHVDPVTALRAE